MNSLFKKILKIIWKPVTSQGILQSLLYIIKMFKYLIFCDYKLLNILNYLNYLKLRNYIMLIYIFLYLF